MTDCANETLPVPADNKTLEIYGKEISGKTNRDTVRIAFIMKFFFTETCFSPDVLTETVCTAGISGGVTNTFFRTPFS